MIELLVTLLVLVLVFGVLYYAITLLPLPTPFNQIAMLILAVIFILILLYYLLPLLHVRPLP